MIVTATIYALLALNSVKAESHTFQLSVEEGKTVTLRCVFPGGNGSDIQWLTPRGYTSYFNGEKVLKDRRYELQHSSRNKLIVRLTNITRADEGVYTCLYYSSPIQTKGVQVSVLSVPSPPSLEVTRIHGKGLKEKYLLTCTTSGGHPCPRLTWLIDNHIEMFGHQNRRLKNDWRCTAVSTLRVSSASSTSRASCVVRHRTLTPGNLTASYSFHKLDDVTSTPAEEYTRYTTTIVKTSGKGRGDESRAQEASSSAPETTDLNLTTSTTEASFTIAEYTERRTTDRVNGNVTSEVKTFTSLSEKNSSLATDVTNTGDSTNTTNNDIETSRRESYHTLILVLVSLMMCILLVIVHLFLSKLRKAHYFWKKENETSDQTLESTKSRSNNEEMSSQSKNGTSANAAPGWTTTGLGHERSSCSRPVMGALTCCCVQCANTNYKVPGIQYNNQVSL
ncbi:cytotoxic and regulatory T-cell molecule isoform X2 [Engystomops pustulosus]|uniref:cytotoxic and regulatory T-cell molecule isoform X2 n=1 Tax=Engystomops pustulosus TaxID=76066 RepID=UPI003AFAF153